MHPNLPKLPLLLLLIVGNGLYAQQLPGYNTGRYAGIAGVELQPASAAHDLYKFDILFIGAEVGFNNNYVSLSRRAIFQRTEWSDNAVNFRSSYLRDNYNDNVKHLYVWNKLYLPSVLFMPTRRLGIAFNWSSRGAFQVRNVDPHVAKLAYEELDYEPLWGRTFPNPDLNLHAVRWQEFSLSAGYKIKDEGAHRWKIGANVKLLRGVNALYLHARAVDFTVHNAQNAELSDADFAFGASEDFSASEFYTQNASGKISAGFGAGIIYQYNPPSLRIEEKWRPEVKQKLELYKFQAGISLVDFGNVVYDRDPRAGDFSSTSTNWNIIGTGFSNINQFADTLRTYFNVKPANGTFSIALPAAVNVSMDYHVYRDFFVNLNHYQAITSKKSSQTLRAVTTTTLTPRLENDAFGAFMPISYSELENVKAGLAFRIGPLVIGTADVNNLLVRRYFRSADVFVLLKWGMLWSKMRPRDLCPSNMDMM